MHTLAWIYAVGGLIAHVVNYDAIGILPLVLGIGSFSFGLGSKRRLASIVAALVALLGIIKVALVILNPSSLNMH